MNGVRFIWKFQIHCYYFFLKKTLFNDHWFGDRGPICRYHSLYPTSNIYFFMFKVSIVDGLNYHIPRLYVSINTVGFLGVWVPVFQDKPPPWDWLPSSVCMAAWKHRLSRSVGIRHKKSWASQVFCDTKIHHRMPLFLIFFEDFTSHFVTIQHTDCNFFWQQQAIIDIEFVGVMRLLKASNLGNNFSTKHYGCLEQKRTNQNQCIIWEDLRIFANMWFHFQQVNPQI